uniref:DH domain-containing protein n=1 Tax=Parascaris equorum TaxID=6256 RepID=A0A914RJC8_PAREQ
MKDRHTFATVSSKNESVESPLEDICIFTNVDFNDVAMLSSLDNLETSNSSAIAGKLLKKLPSSPRRVDKRHAVCREMLETEENYLKALKIIIQTFKEPLEAQANDPESGLLSKAEIMQIFSRVPSLVEVHEKICSELRTYVMHWSTDRLIGKAAESRAECQRNNLRDLLVRPVQRLPSVLLLLKGQHFLFILLSFSNSS